jgi:hypothetical protein
VEHWYAGRLYPVIQGALTTASNLVAVAVFDVVLVMLVVAVLAIWVLAVRRVRRHRSALPLLRAGWTTMVLAAAVYVWFVLAWGLNYARPPLEVRLDLRDVPVTTDAVRALALQAVTIVNESHQAAHASGFPAADATPGPLADAFAAIEREHGRARPTVVSRPKRTMLSWFFQAAGVDGLLAPAAL